MTEKKSIEELEQELKRLQKLVFFDELTGIRNRYGFKTKTEKIFQSFLFSRQHPERRTGSISSISFIFIDLDNFKKINDQYGHSVGDIVLEKMGSLLKDNLRANDIFARWGGEEFVVTLVGADAGIAKKVAEKIQDAIRKTKIKKNGDGLNFTASIGVATYNNEETLEQLIENADKAMYEAKQAGKNRVVVFDEK